MFESMMIVAAPTFEELKDHHLKCMLTAAEAASGWQTTQETPGNEARGSLDELNRQEMQAREDVLNYRPTNAEEAYRKAIYLASFMIGTATALGRSAMDRALKTLQIDI